VTAMPHFDWEDECWGKPQEDWHRAKAEVRGVLVETARRRSVITYTEIANLVASVTIPKLGGAMGSAVGLLLGQVNMDESRRLKRPMMLSAVAVNVEMKPSKGFQDLAGALKVPTSWEHWLPIVWRTYST